MGDCSPERRSGCGLLGAVFGGRTLRPKKSPSPTPVHTTKVQRPDNDSSDSSIPQNDQKQGDRVIPRPGPNHKSQPVRQPQQSGPNTPHQTPPRNATPPNASPQQPGLSATHQTPPRNATPPNASPQQPSSSATRQNPRNATPPNASAQGYGHARKVLLPGMGLSGELDTMIKDHQRSKGAGNLVRASSGNVMMHSNMGNLRQPTGNADDGYVRNEQPLPSNGRRSSTGNVAKKKEGPEKTDMFCRALSTRIDPEELKILGNEDYKNGRFAEALALYEAAISIDPNKASYRSNKSAALTAMGKLLEAALECREAIRIDPSYQRAHNRLATLYVRLGEPEKGLYHFKQAGPEADPDAMNAAAKVQNHLNKCTEAKRQRDWNALVKECGLSTSAGADSSPLIFALKSEALLKLNRHQEAIQTMAEGSSFDTDEYIKFFGPIASASLLVMQAQVGMAEGRFDDAIAAGERACRLDTNNKEAMSVMRKVRTLAAARSHGNDHFKAGRYEEACQAYGEGLEHAPYNALFLCNRAACQAKLKRYEKAIEDCNAALNVRPSYTKARLRRADCYAKMENWGACLQDCQVLLKENPNDEEAVRLSNEAKARLKQH